MDISLGGLRSTVLSMRAWNSSGTTFDNRCREAARLAAAEISSKIPNALFPDDAHVVLYPDVVSSDTDVAARLRATTDRWVLEFRDENGLVLGHPSVATTWTPTITGVWNGVMHLEIQDPDGTWHRRQSRDWWSDTDESGNTTYRVSLMRRWRNLTDQEMAFRIHQPAFWLRGDVQKLLAPAVIWDDTRQQSWPLSTGSAVRMDMPDYQGESTSRPYALYRGPGFQMPTPYMTPTTSPGGNGTWVGPWQEGTYLFRYTLCWGYQDPEWEELPGGLPAPVWESAPSPASAAHDHSLAANQGQRIDIALPNIDAELNFAESGALRVGHTGLYGRVYVAQTAVRTGGAGSASYNLVETPGIYYPLGDVDFDGGAATYTWTGAVIPDRLRQLRHTARYFGWVPHPHQDARYELDLRVLRLPAEFVDDRDTLPLHEAFHPAFLQLFLSYLCVMDGADIKASQYHRGLFESLVEIPRDVDESPAEIVEPEPWGGDVLPDRYGTFAEEV